MMKKAILALMITIACTLVGCGFGNRWQVSHPLYKRAPYKDVALAGTEDAFVLTRSAWFAKKLQIGTDSIQLKVTHFCQQTFRNEFKRIYPDVTPIPQATYKTFPEESQKLDERIFIKGRLPEQGVAAKDSAGNTPHYILILHEFIIGTDLKRENYFDYALIHNERTEKNTSKNVSAIVSYTLWDNEMQRPLFSAVDEIQHAITTPTMADLEALVRETVKQIRINMYGGVS